MPRLLVIFLLTASLRSCATDEFSHEFWLKTDGSGSFVISAPAWLWNVSKNVGEATNLEATVNEESVGALFKNPAILNPRVSRTNRNGRSYLTVSAEFSNVNALVGTRAFPDLVVALRREGDRLRLFGVWRRPASTGTAQGDDSGQMAVRFHLPSQILEQRNASQGVERGNVLSWRQDVKLGVSGSPLDFGATLGTQGVLNAVPGLWGLAVLAGVSLMSVVLILLARHGKKEKRRGSGPPASGNDADFLNYDPSTGPK